MSEWIEFAQWPAFAASVLAAWLVGSNAPARRNLGFWVFLTSNVLWVAWGLKSNALALIALQICLAAMNIRGLWKTDAQESSK